MFSILADIDKPQLNPKAKLKAKAWAEVFYIITIRPRAHLIPVPVPHKVFAASTISPIELKFSG